jgi:peptide deformylase
VGEVEGEIRDEQLEGEREARRQLALAQVRQYPDPVLRMRANEVEEFDEPLATLVERMTALMRDARGVGLAATQVGILQRVLVYQPAEDAPVVALVNPRIASKSEERETADEGCLSLGASSVVTPVERATGVAVEAQTPAGEEITIDAEGLEARVIQHEVDHLEGILTLDRTDDEHRRAALAQLRPQPALR